MTFDILIVLDTVVMRGSCLIVFIVYLLHCTSLVFFLLTMYLYSFIQLLAASLFIKFSDRCRCFVASGVFLTRDYLATITV